MQQASNSARHLSPPSKTPQALEIQFFSRLSQEPPSSPLCSTLTGTVLVPLKRRKNPAPYKPNIQSLSLSDLVWVRLQSLHNPEHGHIGPTGFHPENELVCWNARRLNEDLNQYFMFLIFVF